MAIMNTADHPPGENDAARDRRIYLEEMTRLEDTIAALRADNWRLIQKAERNAPPEIWWPLPSACVVDGERTDRQRKTDHENMRKRCENHSIIAAKRGPARGRWWVRMEVGLDGRMTPMLRK
jgi:hypothetical protein